MSIQQLPENVIAQIKSSTAITSLNAVVCGLIENSLDARATKITISIDFPRGNCSVEDNGLGIPPYEFKPDGGLGKLHYTSKFPARNDIHGRHGTFLASVAALSLLSITSHHYGHHSHNSIKIHNSEILARYTPALPEQRLLSFLHGTRTTVRDLFGSMPVRVKQRAIDAERGANAKEWERLRRTLVALLLAWPGQVSVSLRDSVGGRSLIIRIPEESADSQEKKYDILGLTTRVSRTFIHAQLCDGSSRDLWVPLKASAGQISVVGAVSLVPVASRQLQFISIGVRPVSNEHGSNVLYEEINRLFANSSFGIEEDREELNEEERNRRAKDRRFKTDGYTNQELKGRKGVDRWPMFYIRINLGEQISRLGSCDMEDILDDQHDSLKAIIDIITAVAYEFLKAHHFRPKYSRPRRVILSSYPNSSEARSKSLSRGSTPKLGPRTDQDRTSRPRQSAGDLASTRLNLPLSTFSPRYESPFDSWTRIKTGQPQYAHLYEKFSSNQEDAVARGNSPSQPVPETSHLDVDDDVSETPLVAPDGTLLGIPFPDAETDTHQASRKSTEEKEGPDPEQPQLLEDEILWTNPATKEDHVIDGRTGLVIRPLRQSSQAPGDVCRIPAKKKLRTNTKPVLRDERSKWLDDILSWKNPVFQSPEPPIPVAFDEEKALELATKALEGHCHGCISNPLDTLQASHSVEGRLSRDNLRNSEVIAQVDRKFIFAKAPLLSSPPSNSSTDDNHDNSLILIVDQHAADERCRVEALMKDYFLVLEDTSTEQPRKYVCAQTEVLKKPITFDVSTQDCRQFEQFAEYFGHWGIVYQLKPALKSKPQSKGAAQLKVTRLPPSIAERCRQEPRLLIDLLRKEVWKLDEQGHNSSRHFQTEGNQGGSDTTVGLHWLARFHGCPNGILEMINSRACRSSIMFNDQLSYEECVDLLKRLADCVLPFQCAHGRPSMVPLVDLGNLPLNRTDPGKPTGSFSEQFKRWKASMGS
ncbi:hypothetical protein F4820DRAFT_245403 [Hypoxylon rubiginosum]|uniref:Uncharacterized protein n=1 Tax=Hypoxylon rubiginosum TaxID=110542 RepID=A0ACB9Z4Y6_9PEZI|nr:hypothetical protein F4820DRAFT_245403 [Hypoxylon rubiginosum]